MAQIIKFPERRQRTGRTAGNAALADAPAAPKRPARRKRGRTQEEEERKAMLAKIHIALGELYKRAKTDPDLAGFCEDVYRYKMREDYGKASAADLDSIELHQMLLWLASLGWKARRKRGKDAPSTMYYDPTPLNREGKLEKIEAMLTEKGRVEGTDVPWGYAVSILKRQSGGLTKTFDAASLEQLDSVIAALWRDAKRKGRRVR